MHYQITGEDQTFATFLGGVCKTVTEALNNTNQNVPGHVPHPPFQCVFSESDEPQATAMQIDALAVYVQHKEHISVVLTDMMMPVMDGAATVQALLRINPAVKIIAASGLTSNGGTVKESSRAIKHFLTKPYTAETLLTAIRAILDEGDQH